MAMRYRRNRPVVLLFEVALALGTASCGGSIASELFDTSDPVVPGDASTGDDTSIDASPGSFDAAATCQPGVPPVIGSPCLPEGTFCGGPCTDPCKFCNIAVCKGGVWQRLEAPPDPGCVPDAATRKYPDGWMSWQAPGGFSGLGSAVVVTGDGVVRVWNGVNAFNPTSTPTAAPSSKFALSGAQVDDLFDRFTRIDTTRLPHAGRGADCYGVFYARTCANCKETTLRYSEAGMLAPEMEPLWSWFDGAVPSTGLGGRPRAYCRFVR